MAASLLSTIYCGINSVSVAADVLSDPAFASRFIMPSLNNIVLPNGTASGYADKLYVAERTLAASATESLDLAGVLTDPLTGALLTFVKVRALLVEAADGNTNNVIVGAAAATVFSGWFGATTYTLVLTPGDRILLTSKTGGKAVGAGSTDLLKIANSAAGTSVTYRIAILGTSA